MKKTARWVRLSVDHFDDDKIVRLTDAQSILYLKLVVWSYKHQTDGRIPSTSIRGIAGHHRNLLGSLDRMEALELLHCDRTCADIATPLGQHDDSTYHILAFPKWDMNTSMARDVGGDESPGQPPSDDAPRAHVRAGTPSGTAPGVRQDKKYLDKSQPQVQQAGPVRLVNGLPSRFFPGSGWIPIKAGDDG